MPESNEHRSRNIEFPFRIGYIGTLSKVKGVEWLIRTFMRLDINATLFIAGRGESIEYEEYLKKITSVDKRISFLGYIKPADFFHKYTCLLCHLYGPIHFRLLLSNHVPIVFQ